MTQTANGETSNGRRSGSARGARQPKLPGRLVAVEGVDGSGKSTQIHLLNEWLKHMGCKVFFSEWNSSRVVRGATKRGKKQQLLTPTTFSLIHATDFADRYERQILPMLKAGYVVLCDRYKFTAFARDGVRGCDPAMLRRIYGFARDPDITFYFEVPLQRALNRILSGRARLKWFEAGMDLGYSPDMGENFQIYQGQVMERYQALAGEFDFTRIDATRNVHEMQDDVRRIVADRIDLARFRQPALPQRKVLA